MPSIFHMLHLNANYKQVFSATMVKMRYSRPNKKQKMTLSEITKKRLLACGKYKAGQEHAAQLSSSQDKLSV